MTKSESLPSLDSTCSEQTDDSAHSDDILALGCKLVEELGLEPSVDTLGRWMAHYVADLIATTKSTTGEEKGFTDKKCIEAILDLWKHRAQLPNGKRPHENLEPVVRAIESLDPDDDTPRAKVLIGYCLAEAANAALDKSKEWVKLAEAAGADDGISEIVVRFVSKEADLGREPNPTDVVRVQLQNRIKRLEGFTKLAETVLRDLKTRLEDFPLS